MPSRAVVRRRRLIRDSFRIARAVRPFSSSALYRPPVSPLVLLAGSDRRFFNPAGAIAPAVAFVRGAARIVDRAPPRRKAAAIAGVMAFARPHLVEVCRRRKVRREVLLAKGRGGGKHRRPRRNGWSDVSC